MKLQMPPPPESYRSASQKARWSSEEWGARNLYCPACPSPAVERLPNNSEARDFECPACGHCYQLKSSSSWSTRTVPDAAYDSMMAAVRSDTAPNLLVLQYAAGWLVRNLLLVPHFFLTPSAIKKRAPLAAGARRSGWVGCNISLVNIPADGKIVVVADGAAVEPSEVRRRFESVKPVAALDVSLRGWTLDVLNVVRRLGTEHFVLADVYAFASVLSKLHPENQHVREKIRQQLQVLRDLGFLSFEGRGAYRLLTLTC